ncbi:hypothetical protein HY408_02125 [Candidatus Gottesmanbacteria bacterium]|nr:hypothetical protein [Candidatus Gottesmanbacteria bacterium]
MSAEQGTQKALLHDLVTRINEGRHFEEADLEAAGLADRASQLAFVLCPPYRDLVIEVGGILDQRPEIGELSVAEQVRALGSYYDLSEGKIPQLAQALADYRIIEGCVSRGLSNLSVVVALEAARDIRGQ